MKDWHLCLGAGCARDDDFEDFNCAEEHTPEINVNDPNILGLGMPGCDTCENVCDDGLCETVYHPCEEVIEYEGSAEVTIDWPTPEVTDLIPQPFDHPTPTTQIEVDEPYLPYISEYSMGFWYMFRFRSPVRMEVSEKRSNIHAVAGITEKDTYITSSQLGDRALSLFFDPWS